jgi:hypothetical protein
MNKTMVAVELRNGVMFGEVVNYDGCNVYVKCGNDVYKVHVDQVTEINPNKYYIVEEKQTSQGIVFTKVLPQTRSTKVLGYGLINKLGLPRLSDFHGANGMRYAGQAYYNCRKGSVILK